MHQARAVSVGLGDHCRKAISCLVALGLPGGLCTRKLATHFLDVVVREGAAVFELLAGEDQALLVRRDAFFVLDL